MKKSILIIEDEPRFCQSLKILLETEGFFQVVAVHSCGEGLSALHAGNFHGVVLDIGLPDINGHVIAQNIVEQHPEVVVIILSGENDAVKGMADLRLGVFGYLTKPCNPDHLVGVLHRSLQQKLSVQNLHDAYQIINRSPVIAFLWRNEKGWPVEFVSENVRSLCGYSAEEFISGRISYSDIIHPEDLDRVKKEVQQVGQDIQKKSFQHAPYRIKTLEGQIKWLDDNTYLKRDNRGRITHYQGVVLDITERQKNAELLRCSKQQLEKMHAKLVQQKKILEVISITDELTGLYNRRHLKTVLEQEFERSKRHNTDLSCLLLDLDHFKLVNDRYGHEYGDTVLRNFANILSKTIRLSDFAFRYGGEEFLIILPQTNIEGAVQTGEKIRLYCATEKLKETNILVTVSVGGASLNKHQPEKPYDLITLADKAMYVGKENGRNQVVVCD
jgi:diguanylate cyclase (GGDEF)-like protein/PAS domain S-box-containing protein